MRRSASGRHRRRTRTTSEELTKTEALLPQPPSVPKEILLLLFDWLSKRDVLLGARGVCRQWREAALHPTVWRHRSAISFRALDHAVMLWAPCLRKVEVSCRFSDHGVLLHVVEACAVDELILDLCDADRSFIKKVARALHAQVKLGRLRRLELEWLPSRGAGYIFEAVVEAGLSSLRVWTSSGRLPVAFEVPAAVRAALVPSLTDLRFEGGTVADVLEFWMESHAATLQSVRLARSCGERALRLLASCPQLRKANVPGVEAVVVALSGRPLLRELSVELRGAAPPRLLSYFREAVALTSVKLYAENLDLHGSAMDLLAALALSRRSDLRRLVLYYMNNEEDLRALPGAMAGLRHLQTVKLFSKLPADALDAVTPGNAPALRLLELNSFSDEICDEFPVQCYFASVVRLVVRNPGVHVLGVQSGHHGKSSCAKKPCQCCTQRFHRQASRADRSHDWVGVFGHPPADKCDLAVHVSGTEMRWLLVKEP